MVDVISNGRLDMGVGRGYQPREFAMLGLADQQQHSRAIFSESLEVLIGLWENETFSYHGEHYQFDDVSLSPRPVQKPRPPIYVAAISPESFALVEKYGLNIMVTPTLMSLPELKENVIEAKKRLIKAGRAPESLNFPMNWQMHLAPTREEAEQRPVRVARLVLQPGDGARPEGPQRAEGLRVHARPRRRLRGRPGACRCPALQEAGIIILDDPTGAADKIREVRDDIGQQEVFCWMRIGGLVGREGPRLDEAVRRGSDARVPGRGPGRSRGSHRLTRRSHERAHRSAGVGRNTCNAPGAPVNQRGFMLGNTHRTRPGGRGGEPGRRCGDAAASSSPPVGTTTTADPGRQHGRRSHRRAGATTAAPTTAADGGTATTPARHHR